MPIHVRRSARLPVLTALAAAGLLVAAGCGSSKSSSTTSAGSGGSPTTAAGGSSSPGTMFSTASVAGLGNVVVDGRGRTVYVLTSDNKTNLPCDDASGCTKFWPDLPFPDGVTSAQAGSGIDASKLSSKKLSDGETYPTYNGWLMYEFVNDSGPAQGHGEGIHSFNGTWYALTASGDLVMSASSSTATTAASGGYGGGY